MKLPYWSCLPVRLWLIVCFCWASASLSCMCALLSLKLQNVLPKHMSILSGCSPNCVPMHHCIDVFNQCRAPHHDATQVSKCLSIKGAEDTINKPFAFEISTHSESMFFIAQSEKVRQAQIP